jgi:TRAP-type C4-dicarboxylate transport system permease small subunit
MESPPRRKYAFEGIVATILFIALVICMLLQITARAGLMQPPIWTEELSRWLWVWMAFFGMAEVERRNEHLVVDFFINRFPEFLRRPVLLGLDLVYLVVIGGLIWIGCKGVIRQIPSQAVTMPTTDAVLYASFPVAAVFIGARIALRMAGRLRSAKPVEHMS